MDGFTDVEGTYVYAHRAEATRNIYVNRDFVSEQELNRIEDLVDPKWRGKVSWQDPRAEGTGSVDAGHMLMIAGEHWLRQLLAQEPAVTRDQRQQVDWLVRGRYAIANSPAREPMEPKRSRPKCCADARQGRAHRAAGLSGSPAVASVPGTSRSLL
jgi:ABC-type Fe3+ transport system substrate-binding protein